MKASLCIETHLKEFSIEKRMEIAKKYGFEAIEFWNINGKDIDGIKEALDKNNQYLSICMGEDHFIHNLMTDKFILQLNKSIEPIKKLSCRQLIIVTGQKGDDDSLIMKNLEEGAKIANENDIILNIEPLNTVRDHKGYYLDKSKDAFDMVSKINSPNLKVLYDVYHMYLMGEDVLKVMKENISYIGHVHIAGASKRQEPSLCDEIDYKAIFDMLKKEKYSGHIGLEYNPVLGEYETLEEMSKWCREFGIM